MIKFLYKDEPYFYKISRAGNLKKYWIYEQRKGFLGFFKYKLIGRTGLDYWLNEDLSERDVKKIIEPYKLSLQNKPMFLFDCSPEVKEIYESSKS
jgi:hypothetical protein